MKIKRVLAVIIAALLLLPTAGGCTGPFDDGTEYIGIISAMDNEIEVLLNEMETERTDTIGGMVYHVGTLRGQPVVISRSGIGKVRVSSGTTAMFNNYSVSKVIFTGIAGGVADETQVFDQVIATRLVEHDYGRVTNDGFLWLSGDPGVSNEPGSYYYCDRDMVDLAYNAAVEVMGASHVFKGTIATGDQFIASEDYVERLRKEFDAYACEMEGASVAVVCMNYGKPFVVIRALSDKADGNAHESYDNFGDLAGANSSRIVLKMLESMGK